MATKKMIKKDLQYYLQLPWTYSIETVKDKTSLYYIICVNELPGVCTDAPSIEEGMQLIREAMTSALELYIKHGDQVPEPIKEEQFKGKITYHTSSRRHFVLAKEAQRKSKSVDQIIDECIDSTLSIK